MNTESRMGSAQVIALMRTVAPTLRDFVGSSVAPIVQRVAALEARPVTVLHGSEETRAAIEMATAPLILQIKTLNERIDELQARAPEKGDPGLPGAPGKNGDPLTPEQIASAVAQHLKANPVPDGAKGDPGASATAEQVEKAVAAYLVANPVQPGKPGDPGKPGASVKGDDGRGVVDALIDADGKLVLTFTDGAIKAVGLVRGRDGVDAKGVAGKDGFGFDDMTVVHDGERGFALRFAKGDDVKEFPFTLSIPLYRGVFKEGEWKRGDAVTWGGSLWIAERDTTDKPDGSDAWRLAVKRGQNGRDLMPKPEHRGPVKA